MHPYSARLTPRQAARVERAIRSTELASVLDENLQTGDRIQTLEEMVQRACEMAAEAERGLHVVGIDVVRTVVRAYHNARAGNPDQWADPEPEVVDPLADSYARAAAIADAGRVEELHHPDNVIVVGPRVDNRVDPDTNTGTLRLGGAA